MRPNWNEKVGALEEDEFKLSAVRINFLMAEVGLSRDVSSFEELYKHFSPRVRSYMMRLTRGDRVLAEELTQETMMKVWKKADLFDPEKARASTWIFTIARNQRIDAIRRSNRPEFDPYDPAFVPAETEAADIGIEKRQDAQQLWRAMLSLKEKDVEVLRMSFFDGMTHSVIAEKLSLPLGTVKSRIRLACDRLRLALQDQVK